MVEVLNKKPSSIIVNEERKKFVDRFQSNNSILRLFAIIQVAHVFGYQSLNDFFHSTMDILIPLVVAGQVAVCIKFVAQKFKNYVMTNDMPVF